MNNLGQYMTVSGGSDMDIDVSITCNSNDSNSCEMEPEPEPAFELLEGDAGDGSGDESLSTLSTKVFENDMLREMILKNVIWNSNNTVSRTDIRSLRLVRKSWVRTVSENLRKNRDPVFQLNLKRENSVTGSLTPEYSKRGKLLDQFVKALTTDQVRNFEPSVPTFSLKLAPDFFRRENYQNFSDCLINCGPGLIDLDVCFPVNSSMTFVFQAFSLPKLQRLAVQFSDQRLLDVAMMTVQNNGHTIYPLQTILNGTEELKELIFKYVTTETLIPFGFEYLKLPPTINKLILDCAIKNSDLEILLKNDLPCLTHLRLFATNQAYSDGLIFKILDKFKSQLKTLNLRGNQYHGRVRNSTVFTFPPMEKLQTITVTSQCWELEAQNGLRGLDTQLPCLNELRILHTTDSMLEKWTAHSKYNSVNRLFVSLININVTAFYHPQHAEHPLTLNLERMQSIHMAFPNVTCLEISVCGPQTCGLKYLFMEMKNLQKLAITLKGSAEHIHPVHWDALLIGAPPDMAASLRRNRDFWNNLELKDDNTFPSIRKLNELKSLALVENFVPSQPEAAGTAMASTSGSLISDMTFHFALLRMPNLKHLLLSGRFMVTPNMMDRWKQEKDTVIHSIRKPW